MDIALLLGLLLGAVAIPRLRHLAVTAGRIKAVMLPLVVTLYGVLPAVLIGAGLISNSGVRSLAAVAYFVVFSVTATVVLTGARARAELNDEV
jgi:hypothetical protein